MLHIHWSSERSDKAIIQSGVRACTLVYFKVSGANSKVPVLSKDFSNALLLAVVNQLELL